MTPRLPNFFLIGVSKSGTTTLHQHLAAHPDIFMSPVKEPFFLAYDGGPPPSGPNDTNDKVLDRSSYEDLFRDAGDAKRIGESSAGYLCEVRARNNLKDRFPQARLIAILRDPVERAYSHYLHRRRAHVEYLDFRECLAAEPARRDEGWHSGWLYQSMGLYGEQLEHLFNLFPRDQVAVHLYEDLARDPASLMRSLYEFLGVDPTFQPDLARRYGSRRGVGRNRFLQRLLSRPPNWLRRAASAVIPSQERRYQVSMRIQEVNLKDPPDMDPDLRAMLVESFVEDVRKLEGLIDRDLSHWLQGAHNRQRI